MDAHLFRLFAEKAYPLLLNSRIEKIQEAAPGILLLGLYGGDKKFQLCIRFGRKNPFCFISHARITASGVPTANIMRLRRYFGQKRVISVVFQYLDRKIWLLCNGTTPWNEQEKVAWLCLDLANGPSIHFLEEDQAPESNEENWPECQLLTDAVQNWRNWPVLTPVLRKTLMTLEKPEQCALIEDLRAGNGNVFLYCQETDSGHKKVVKICAWPLPSELRERLVEEEREDVLSAMELAGQDMVLGELYQDQTSRKLLLLRNRIRQIEKLLAKLDADQSRLEAMKANEASGLILQQNLWRWPADLRARHVTIENSAGECKKVELSEKYSVRENMRRFFHCARRGKRGLAMLAERRERLTRELEELASGDFVPVNGNGNKNEGLPETSKIFSRNLPANVEGFISSDGHLILRGKNAKGNMTIRKMAVGHDIWCHAENGPGAHVLVRRPHAGFTIPETTLEEAGTLAACKSWLAEAETANIVFVESRHVKAARKGSPGQVLYDKVYATRIVKVDHQLEKRLRGEGPGLKSAASHK